MKKELRVTKLEKRYLDEKKAKSMHRWRTACMTIFLLLGIGMLSIDLALIINIFEENNNKLIYIIMLICSILDLIIMLLLLYQINKINKALDKSVKEDFDSKLPIIKEYINNGNKENDMEIVYSYCYIVERLENVVSELSKIINKSENEIIGSLNDKINALQYNSAKYILKAIKMNNNVKLSNEKRTKILNKLNNKVEVYRYLFQDQLLDEIVYNAKD